MNELDKITRKFDAKLGILFSVIVILIGSSVMQPLSYILFSIGFIYLLVNMAILAHIHKQQE